MKKYLGIVIGALLVSSFVGCNLIRHSEHHKESKMGSLIGQNYVQKWFDGLNEVYFNGTLAPTRVLYSSGPDGDSVIGETFCDINPNGGVIACTIYINPKYNTVEAIAAETVIHESCHAAVYNEYEDHGPRWQGCMKRLANQGAFEGVW
jgi:hypothetical protein